MSWIFFILTAVQIDARALFCHSTLTKAVTLTSHSLNDLPLQDFLDALKGSDMNDDSGVKVGGSETRLKCI